MITSKAVYIMQEFHFHGHYYSEQPDCPAQFMGDGRGTYDKELEVWTPLTDTEAHVYWDKCDCGLAEAVESLIGGEE